MVRSEDDEEELRDFDRARDAADGRVRKGSMMPLSIAARYAALQSVKDMVLTVVRVDVVALNVAGQAIPGSRKTYKAGPGDTIEHKRPAPVGTQWWSAVAYNADNVILYWNDFRASKGDVFTYAVPTDMQVTFEA